jgi:exodeoxyribonuclease VII small subunit
MKKAREREEESVNFDHQMEKLKNLVEQMEQGGLSLDESLKLFEEGISLSRHLFGLLNQAEGKVEELLSTLEKVPFAVTEEHN